MQVDFSHGIYKDRPVFFGDVLSPLDSEAYASMQASLDAFYNALRQASAGERNAVLASAIASLESSAGRAAEAAYNQAKASGQSEAAAKAVALGVSQQYRQQEAAYRKTAAEMAFADDAERVGNISAKAAQARALLNKGFNVLGPDYQEPKPPSLLPVLLAAGAAYLALKG